MKPWPLVALTLLLSTTATAATLQTAEHDALKQPSHSDTPVQVVIQTPGQTQTLTFNGEPRLQQLTEQLRWQDVYWPSARLCSAKLQHKLQARRAGVIAQLRMLQNVWRHDGEPQLADATGALIEQVQQWPLLANFSNAGEQGIEPAADATDARRNWLLKNDQQPYFFSVGDQPQQVHWIGLTDKPGSYTYSHQLLSDWLQRRQAQPLTASDVIWEVTLNGRHQRIGLSPHNSNNDYLQPGAILFSGFEPHTLPAGFADTNRQLLQLLRYW